MPGISPIKILGNLKFLSHNLKLPVDFKKPQGDPSGKHYGDAFSPPDRLAPPRLVPPWFLPAETPNKYYQDSCDTVGQAYKDLHDAMIDAVQFAHNMWKLQAHFKSIQVMAVAAIGAPGCLDGPALESLIKNAPSCAALVGNAAKHRDAVAQGVSKCFKSWQDQVTVPGLPWYPAFAAFPSAMAPPMPNIPMPLITCVSAKMTDIVMPDAMKQAMGDALDGEVKRKDPSKQYEALHDGIATVLALAFLTWLPAQQVSLVLGKGPIPTFAPPFVPVGPVMGGDIIAAPGHLMS